MKRYKLLKDLPFAKAGEFFSLGTGKRNEISELTIVGENHTATVIWKRDIEDFDEWFEEVEELKTFFLINNVLSEVVEHNIKYYKDWQIENLKSVGNYFETREEAEKYLEYLKAKAIIKQDAKGFKPDWQNADEERYCGKWDFDDEIPHISILNIFKAPQIYFKSKKDIQESFKKHPEEWKAYLTYEQ